MDQVHHYFTEHIFRLITEISSPGEKELLAFNHAVETFFRNNPDGCLLANLSLENGLNGEAYTQRIHQFFDDWQACYFAVFSQYYSPALAKDLAEDSVAIVHGSLLMYRINHDIAYLYRQHHRLMALLSSAPQTEY